MHSLPGPHLRPRSPEKGAAVTLTEIVGYAAALLVLLTFSMRTMVHLRAVGLLSNLFFIAYGYLSGAYPIMVLHAILLPLNSFRLFQIISLLRKVEYASKNGFDVDWLKSLATPRTLKPGEFLFRKGDAADRMAFIVSGSFRMVELGKDIGPGELTGELGLIAPTRTRTQTLECTSAARVLEVTYEQVKLLYFQSPKFALYLLELAGNHLFTDIERLEKQVEMYRSEKEIALLGAPVKREA
jgi:CRP/FNR family cyclic AMP-dependent transcriptional regulator